MSKRLSALAMLPLLLLVCLPLHAQERDRGQEMRGLQASLTAINLELRADFDQIAMLQEAIRANARTPLEAQGHAPDMVQFDDVAAAERQAIAREKAMNARLDAILARTAALDERKQPLVERIRDLGGIAPGAAARLDTAPQ